jgi:dCTP deaminase
VILSDADIKRALADRRLIITPSPPAGNFSTTSLDLRVGNEFKRWKKAPRGMDITINLSDVRIPEYGEYVEDVPADQDGLVAVPKDTFLLAKTLETVRIPLTSKLAARVEGRSSFARLGLAVHITAPTVHAGFEGPIVLEIKNLGPFTLKLEPGKTPICQMIFEKVSSQPEGPLLTDFQKQTGVLGKRPK